MHGHFPRRRALPCGEAVLAVLGARGIEPSEQLRERILSCTDLASLELWLARAAVAQTAADVVGE